jgi:hypothetical protein
MMRAALVLAALLAGCGYRLAGTELAAPPGAHTVSVLVHNHTRENGLDVHLRRALEDEFRRQGTLAVADDGGDVTLIVDIRRFTNVAVAFNAIDEAVQYQGIIQVHVRFAERATGRVIRDIPLLQETQDFGAVSGVVIASSPHFQRGTMDPRDLANLTNVQIGEARRHVALHDLVELVARDVYLQAMEGF